MRGPTGPNSSPLYYYLFSESPMFSITRRMHLSSDTQLLPRCITQTFLSLPLALPPHFHAVSKWFKVLQDLMQVLFKVIDRLKAFPSFFLT